MTGSWPSSPAMSSPASTWTWDDTATAGDYSLDKLGNWVAFDDDGTDDIRQHNEVNEIAAPDSGGGLARTYGGNQRHIEYDAAGNVIVLEESGGSKTWQFTYDYRNRLIKAENDVDDDGVTCLYDGLNRRVVKKVLDTGTDTLYIYDGWRCVEERNAASPGTVLRKYVYGSPYIDELACKIELDGGETRMYYLQDANYNVVALADANGDVQERCWYEPYGTVTFTDETGAANTPSDESDYDNTLTFQGRRLDTETGLYYFRNRYYSPELGRFVERDPAGYVDGMGLYEFVQSRPTSGKDPYGNCDDDLCDSIISSFHAGALLSAAQALKPEYQYASDLLQYAILGSGDDREFGIDSLIAYDIVNSSEYAAERNDVLLKTREQATDMKSDEVRLVTIEAENVAIQFKQGRLFAALHRATLAYKAAMTVKKFCDDKGCCYNYRGSGLIMGIVTDTYDFTRPATRNDKFDIAAGMAYELQQAGRLKTFDIAVKFWDIIDEWELPCTTIGGSDK